MRSRSGNELRFEAQDERRLGLFRNALLTLHRVLLDAARYEYERAHGRVENHLEMFRLVKEAPTFAWLRVFTDLIVRLDEALDQPEQGKAEELISEAQALLLSPGGDDASFQFKYREALQAQPDVVLAHAEMARSVRALLNERFVLVPAT